MTGTIISPADFGKQADQGRWMYKLASELFPICRSVTGEGVRRSLDLIGTHIPLTRYEVPSGTAVFDWTVPKEWNIRDAYIRDSAGRKIVDFKESNLHVVSYSVPVQQTISLPELKAHLHTLPAQPDRIPYRTSYYKETWGFCMAETKACELRDGDYEVLIDSTLEPGSLTYAECYLPGESEAEILISSHICHPSLGNDNLSGVAVSAALAKYLSALPHRYSYRFLFIPGTIGAITWLAQNQDRIERIKHGLVLTCVGDAGAFHYKRSRQSNAEIDRAAAHALEHSGHAYELLDFSPYGYDERQFCSPGINIAAGCFMRSVHGTFSEYHTSADNLEFINQDRLAETLEVSKSILRILEGNRRYYNTSPMGEPQLGKRGLYRATGGTGIGQENLAMLWLLNQSDGTQSLLDVAERSKLPFPLIQDAADALIQQGLLVIAEHQGQHPDLTKA